MLTRIVKMVFEASKIENFQQLFDQNQDKIRNFEGCQHLELYRDIKDETIFFTYSYWKDEESLENYRHSELFRKIWNQTRKLFSEKPEVWSVVAVE